MELSMILLSIALFVGIFFSLAAQGVFRRTPTLGGVDEDAEVKPAFDGGARFADLSKERIAEIQPFIDRAGILSFGERTPGRGEGNDPIFTFEIYVLDSNGATHTVAVVEGHDQAAQIARKVAARFDVPLDDPDYVTAGR